MNIKSLILGSAAALVAAGSAQAADLPVAEPVDYVKVCSAYGAGYYYLPGTDTCFDLSGHVEASIASEGQWEDDGDRNTNDHVTIGADIELNFTWKEETELGTLVGYTRLTSASNMAKAYLALGGFYAGLTDSAMDIKYDFGLYNTGFYVGGSDRAAVGYNMALGNGVSAHIAIEDIARERAVNAAGVAYGDAYAADAMPAVAAALRVSQGWGEARLSASVSQIRYATATPIPDTDYGYAIGLGAKVNLDMLSAGSYFALAGSYGYGALDQVGGVSALANASDTTGASQNAGYSIAATLAYAFADNVTFGIDGGYAKFNDRAATDWDSSVWGVGATVKYNPVKNLEVAAGVGYTKYNYDAADTLSGGDKDGFDAKLRLRRKF